MEYVSFTALGLSVAAVALNIYNIQKLRDLSQDCIRQSSLSSAWESRHQERVADLIKRDGYSKASPANHHLKQQQATKGQSLQSEVLLSAPLNSQSHSSSSPICEKRGGFSNPKQGEV